MSNAKDRPPVPAMLYGVDEAAIALSLSRSVLYELIRSGRLRTVKAGRRRLVPVAALDEYVHFAGRCCMTARRSHGEGGLYWNDKRRTLDRQTSEDGISLGRDGYTVRQAVEDWLAYGLARQGPATVEKYRIFCGKHVIPFLGARKLRDLTAREVDAWLIELSASLSTDTLHRVRSCLNRSVRRAMARDLVKRNVVELTQLPNGQAGRRSKSLTPEQVDAVLTKTAPDRLHHYIVLSLLTGARTEELRALRWDHVHLGPGRQRPATCRGLAVGAAQRRHEDQEVAADTRTAGQVR